MKKLLVVLLILSFALTSLACSKGGFKTGETILAPRAGYFWVAKIDSISLFGDKVKFTYSDNTKGTSDLKKIKKMTVLNGVSTKAKVLAKWENRGAYDFAEVVDVKKDNVKVKFLYRNNQVKQLKMSDLCMD